MGWKRAGKKNRHHDFPKSRKKKGEKIPNNILMLDIARHAAFHFLFGNRTLLEAAALLKRTHYYQERRKDA